MSQPKIPGPGTSRHDRAAAAVMSSYLRELTSPAAAGDEPEATPPATPDASGSTAVPTSAPVLGTEIE